MGLTGPEKIAQLEIVSAQPDGENALQKSVILDVVARDGRQRVFDIEVQVHSEPAFAKRAFYYLARLAASELDRGQKYRELPKMIGISILDFVMFPERASLHSVYSLYDRKHEHELRDLVELHFVELPKFRQGREPALATPFERWLQLLKFADFYNENRETIPKELEEEEGVIMALDAMHDALSRDEVRVMMALRDKAQRDEYNRLQTAIEEGEARGEATGRRKAARALIAAGADPQLVQTTLGLKPEDLD